jgi:hypothetical protein
MSYVKGGGNSIACPSLIFGLSGSAPPYVYFFYANFGAQNGNGLLNLLMFG